MSHSDIRVVPGPANYYSHPGSLARLQDFYSEEQLSRAVWVYGERAIAGAQAFLPAAFNAPDAKKILFKGHCSESDVSELARASGDDRSVVIGVGGGALLDTAKALARRLGLPVVAIPTIAATCAAWTPLSVWYNDAGQALQFEIFDDANFLVLVEPHIILNAPAEYLLAGIGDTLAKWYEAVVLAPQPETLPLTVRLGINGALAIRDVLLESSETALADQQRGELTVSRRGGRGYRRRRYGRRAGRALYPRCRRPRGAQRADGTAADREVSSRDQSRLRHSGPERPARPGRRAGAAGAGVSAL